MSAVKTEAGQAAALSTAIVQRNISQRGEGKLRRDARSRLPACSSQNLTACFLHFTLIFLKLLLHYQTAVCYIECVNTGVKTLGCLSFDRVKGL